MGAGVTPSYSDLPSGATVLPAPAQFSDLPKGAKVLPATPGNAPGTITGSVAEMHADNGSPLQGAYRKYAGPYIDRAESYMGENLRNFGDAIMHPSVQTEAAKIKALHDAPPGSTAAGLIDRYSTDPAALAGDVGTAALTSTIMGKPPGINLAEASGSTFVPEGLAHPVQGLVRGIKSIPEPDLISAVKHPITSAAKSVMAIPNAIKAGLGENIRIQPAPRAIPAWQQATAEGTEVPSIVNRQPYAQEPSPRPSPVAPVVKQRPMPAWKQSPNEGTTVPSIVDQQPFAQEAVPRQSIPITKPEPVEPPLPTRGKVPIKVVRQSSALGPNAQTLQQAQALKAIPAQESADVAKVNAMRTAPPVMARPGTVAPDIANWQAPPELGVTNATDYGQTARAAVQAKMGALPRSKPIPEGAHELSGPARFSESPRFDYQASGQKPIPYAWEEGGRGRGDFLDDKAVQEQLRNSFDRDERITASQAARDFAARNSMDTPKNVLIRQSQIAKPIPQPEDLTPEWQEELDRRQAAKKGKNAKP